MRPLSQSPIWLLFFGASPAIAVFQEFSFAGNGGNSSALRKCGTGSQTMPYACNPPNMCSKDTRTGKWYCCAPGISDAVCWNGASKCDGQGTGVPSDQQLGCTAGSTKYCCIKEDEQCTKLQGQFNICWSTQDNALAALNGTKLNETFSSLSSANPSAASYPVERAQILAFTSTTPGASTPTPSTSQASGSAASTSTIVSGTSSPAPTTSDDGLSGGAIGGIVGGVVGGLALLGAIGFFLWRRRKNAAGKTDPYAPPTDPYQGYGYQPGYQPQEGYSPQPPVAQLHAPSPQSDKYAYQGTAPLVEAPTHQNPVEMDANYYQQSHHGPK